MYNYYFPAVDNLKDMKIFCDIHNFIKLLWD